MCKKPNGKVQKCRTIFTESGKIKARWNCFFYKLFNSENPREQLDEIVNTEGPLECFSSGQLKKQMANMRKEKHADQINSL